MPGFPVPAVDHCAVATGGGGGGTSDPGFDVESLILCDVMPDGTIVGSALASYEYDAETGNPVGLPTFVDPVSGAPYTPQGTLQPCMSSGSGTSDPGFDVESLILCDVLADGTVAGSVVASYVFDASTGLPVGAPTFVDPVTGAAYTPQGTLEPCATGGAAEAGFDVESLILCDVLADGTVAASVLVSYVFDVETGLPTGPPTFVDPVTGVAYVPTGTLQLCATGSGSGGAAFEDALVCATVGGVMETAFRRETVEPDGTTTVVFLGTDGAVIVPDTWEPGPCAECCCGEDLCQQDDNGIFYRRTSYDDNCDIVVENVDVNGNPYTPVGVVTACGGTTPPPSPFGTITADRTGNVPVGTNVVLSVVTTEDETANGVEIAHSINGGAFVRQDDMVSADGINWGWTAPGVLYSAGQSVVWKANRVGDVSENTGPTTPPTVYTAVPIPVLTLTTDDADGQVTIGTPVTLSATSNIDPVEPLIAHYSLNGGTTVDAGPMTEVSALAWSDVVDTSALTIGDSYELWVTADGGESNHVTVELIGLTLALTATPPWVLAGTGIDVDVTASANPLAPVNLFTSVDAGTTWVDQGPMTEATPTTFEDALDTTGMSNTTLSLEARTGSVISNRVDVNVQVIATINSPTYLPPDPGLADPTLITVTTSGPIHVGDDMLFKYRLNGGAITDGGPMVRDSDTSFSLNFPAIAGVADGDEVLGWGEADLSTLAGTGASFFYTIGLSLVLTTDQPAVAIDGTIGANVEASEDPADPVHLWTSTDDGVTWADAGAMTELTATTFEAPVATTGFVPVDADSGYSLQARSGAVVSNTVKVGVQLAGQTLDMPIYDPAEPEPTDNETITVRVTDTVGGGDGIITGTDLIHWWYKVDGGADVDFGPMTRVNDGSFEVDFPVLPGTVSGTVITGWAVAEGSGLMSPTKDLTYFILPVTLTMTPSDLTPPVNRNPVIDVTAAVAPAGNVHLWVSRNGGEWQDEGAMGTNGSLAWQEEIDVEGDAVGTTYDVEARANDGQSNTEHIVVRASNIVPWIGTPVLNETNNEIPENVDLQISITLTQEPPIGETFQMAVSFDDGLHELRPMTKTGLVYTATIDESEMLLGRKVTVWGSSMPSDVQGPANFVFFVEPLPPFAVLTTEPPDEVTQPATFKAVAITEEDQTGGNILLHVGVNGAPLAVAYSMIQDGTNPLRWTFDVPSANYLPDDVLVLAAALNTTPDDKSTEATITVLPKPPVSWILAPVSDAPAVGTDLPVTINDTLFANPSEVFSIKLRVNGGPVQSFPAPFVSQGVWQGTVPGATFVAEGDEVVMWGNVAAGDQDGPSVTLTVGPEPTFSTLTINPPLGGQALIGAPLTISGTADGDPTDPVSVWQSLDGGTTWADLGAVEDSPTAFHEDIATAGYPPGSTVHFEARSGAVVSNRVSAYFHTNLGTLIMTPPGPVERDEVFEPTLTTVTSLPGRMMITYVKKGDLLPITDNKPMSGAHPTYVWGTMTGAGLGVFDEDSGILLSQAYSENNPSIRSDIWEQEVLPGTPSPAGGLGTITTVPATFVEGGPVLTVNVVNGSGIFLEPVNLWVAINDAEPTLVAAMPSVGTSPKEWEYVWNAPPWTAGQEVELFAKDSDPAWGPAGWRSGSIILNVT